MTSSGAWESDDASRRRVARAVLLDRFAGRLFAAAAGFVGLCVLALVVFVLREASPVLTGTPGRIAAQPQILPGDVDRVDPGRLRSYLGLGEAEFRRLDRETLRLLLEVRAESLASDPDGRRIAEALSLRRLVLPHAWEGYPEPAFVWQPDPVSPKYNLVPLLVGSLKVSFIALLVGVPLALAAAVHGTLLSGSARVRRLRPTIELLGAVPGVVLGAVALAVVSPWIQRVSGTPYPLNAAVAGLALAVAVVPQVFAVACEALEAIPAEWSRTALALGATPWQAARRVVLPAALPGLLAAVVIAFGRAFGETMILLVASGNAPMLGWSPWIPARTLSATIAAELGETSPQDPHHQVLFVAGSLLLLLSFVTQWGARAALQRLAPTDRRTL